MKDSFEDLQGWRPRSLSGQHLPVLGHPHGEKVFPGVQREPSMFQVVPVASSPVAGHH